MNLIRKIINIFKKPTCPEYKVGDEITILGGEEYDGKYLVTNVDICNGQVSCTIRKFKYNSN